MPDLTDTVFDIGTFRIHDTGEAFIQTYPQGRLIEVVHAFLAFTAAGAQWPVPGVYRFTISEDGNFYPLGRVGAQRTTPEELGAVHAILREANRLWSGRDDMGDIRVGEVIHTEHPDGTTIRGVADHVSSMGVWYTAGGHVLVPASDDVRWRRA
jgi:hypothetical protein